MKKIIIFTSLSSFGRCSTSVILPIFSTLKIQCIAIPTTILPTHTGGFLDVSKFVMTELLEKSLISFKSNNIPIDCIYSGYISDYRQLEKIDEFLSYYNDAIFIMDPCIADNNRLYSGIQTEIIDKMKSMAKKSADILFLNLTEAFFLLDKKVDNLIVSEDKVISLINEFVKDKPKKVFITGVQLLDNNFYNFYYDDQNKIIKKYKFTHTKVNYPGTGDIFASIVISYILNKKDVDFAIKLATDFIYKVIVNTKDSKENSRNGIHFEEYLSTLK